MSVFVGSPNQAAYALRSLALHACGEGYILSVRGQTLFLTDAELRDLGERIAFERGTDYYSQSLLPR